MAGEQAERQETGVVNFINNAVKKNKKNPITLVAGKESIKGVVGAEKFKGRQASGSEPYTDVVLTLFNKKTVNLSLKGESAPSLAGGGLKGIETIIPGLTKRFLNAVLKHLITKVKLNPGDKVPDVYGKISPKERARIIVVGNKNMGGPIDFMYIGPMNVTGRYDEKKNMLTLNGNLIEANEFAYSHNLYFRLRARREDQRFDPETKTPDGSPRIYSKSTKGDVGGRIVVAGSTPNNAETITF